MVPEKLQRVALKSRKLKDLWLGLLHNYANDLGLRQEQTNYNRFLILGRSRVGSNLLRSYLNSHSQIILFGEIFRQTGEIGWDFRYYPQTEAMVRLMQEEPVAFVERELYGCFPRHITAVGFKIFYYHAHEGATAQIWNYLHEHREIKVLHLKRRNILRTYLSRERAMESNVWRETGSASGSGSVAPMRLSYAGCLEIFTSTRQWEEDYDALFAEHEKLNLTYESLASQPEQELERVQHFLGVEVERLHTETHRQSGRRLVDMIENYHELKAQFAATPWAEFFED